MIGDGAPSVPTYDLPEEQLRELAIARATTHVQDVAEVLRRAVPGVRLEDSSALVSLAHAALEVATSRVRAEHRTDRDEWSVDPLFGRPGVAMPAVASPPMPDPHHFERQAGQSNADLMGCASCGHERSALVHHPDLITSEPWFELTSPPHPVGR